MRARTVFYMFLSVALLALTACGGGGGGAGTSGATVSGVASKGPIKNGHIQAFQIFSSHDPAKARLAAAPFATATTDDKGNYTLSLPAGFRDGLMVKVVDGTYIDEATKLEKHIETEFPEGMRASFGNMSGVSRRGERAERHVTPYTELAVSHQGTRLDDAAAEASRHEIENAFGLDDKGIDIIHSKPLDPTVAAPAGATDDSKAYTHHLSLLSEYAKEHPAAQGTLDDLKHDLLFEIEHGGLTPDTRGKLDVAELNVIGGGLDDNLPGVTPAVIPALAVAVESTSGLTNGGTGVTITATVTNPTTGAPMSGLEVKFGIKSGAGTLSRKSELSGADGKATSVVTSATNNDANIITVSVGGVVSKDADAITFILQPTLATIKLSTVGVPSSASIGGLTVKLTLPAGVTLKPVAGGETAAGVITGPTGALVTGNYTPAVGATPGSVTIGIISTGGFAGGEFATVTADIASGTFPKPADFAVSITGNVIDTSTATLAGVTAALTESNK